MVAISSIDPRSRSKTQADQSDPAFATTLAHGLDVLAAFRNRSGSLSNAELSLHTGLSRPTVSRLSAIRRVRWPTSNTSTNGAKAASSKGCSSAEAKIQNPISVARGSARV